MLIVLLPGPDRAPDRVPLIAQAPPLSSTAMLRPFRSVTVSLPVLRKKHSVIAAASLALLTVTGAARGVPSTITSSTVVSDRSGLKAVTVSL